MKFLKSLSKVFNNARFIFKAILSNDTIIGSRDIEKMMVDQIGSGWIDRIMSVKGKMNPDFVDSVINAASSRTNGRLGRLYELMYYIESDPRIGGLIEKRVGAASKVRLQLTPGDKSNSQSVEATEFLEKYISDIRFKSFIEGTMDGRKYGVTAFHNIIKRDGDRYYFDDPTNDNQISQSRWWQSTSNDVTWGKLYLKKNNGEKLFLDNPDQIHPAQLSVFINKYKKGYYDTTGFMSRVTRIYVAKIWTMIFYMQSLERYGKPFVYTNLMEKNFKDPEFRATVENVLKKFGAERWGVFPDGFNIESLDTKSAFAADMHMSLLNYLNVESAVTIVGQNLSTEVQGGSFAAAVAHADVEKGFTERDVEWIEEQLNDNFFYWLVKLNYPALDDNDYPKVGLSPILNIDLEKISRGLKAASELIPVPESEIYARTQIRQPILKKDADENSAGQDRFDERIVHIGRSSRADQLIRGLGG